MRGRKKGTPKTGGRKRGTPNHRTQESVEKAEMGGIMPLDYMLMVMRDETKDPLLRADMAKSAAPYLHARRAPESKDGKPAGVTVIIESPE